MPLKIFLMCNEEESEKKYQDWIDQNIGIRISSKHLCSHGTCDHLYIFYDTPNEDQYRKDIALLNENSQLEMLISIARSLKVDDTYKALTNKTQRRLYLLHEKNLPACDADKLMELMTPQLSSLIEGKL